MENQLSPEEVADTEETLTAGTIRILNKASHDRLVHITTLNGKALELTWDELEAQIQTTSEPLARVALVEQPVVNVWIQIGFLASWWIQNPQAEGLPHPPWVGERWTTPEWDPTNPPIPAWIRTWITQWKERNQRQADETTQSRS
ncbi:hypothetical protein [Actinomyces naeslundii]|uniref:hypothetical protein n=1 Tax=Actinomyces naeslundii TaxID=1655 RepID=UPI0015C53F8B|nr:hypothetical protein [Actinomyces naeslundii]